MDRSLQKAALAFLGIICSVTTGSSQTSSPTPFCTDDTWTPTSTSDAPDAREVHTAVWTGDEMIVWGGATTPPLLFQNTGGRYNPSTNGWTPTSISNAPTPRDLHTAV